MADEILGISGQMDISDIERSFSQLINELDKIGVKTNEVSERMNNALKDISNGVSSDNGKVQATLQILRDGISEINKTLTDTPERVKTLASELKTAEDTVGKLKSKMSQETEGSKKWTEINSQIASQNKLVEQLTGEYNSLWGSFGNAQQYVGSLMAAIDAVNATGTISNATNAVSAGIHSTTAVAVGVESVAHAGNAASISSETQATKENIEVSQQIATAKDASIQSINGEVEALGRLIERLKQGGVSEEEYNQQVEEANKTYQQLMSERAELLEKERAMRNEAYTFTVSNGEIVDNGNVDKAQAADALLKNANRLKADAEAISEKLRVLEETYNATAKSVEITSQKEEESTNKTTDAIRVKEDELKKLNEQLELMEAHHEKGWGGDFLTSLRAGDNPFNVIKNYYTEGDNITETKEKISQLTEELDNLRNSTDEIKSSSSDIWANYSAEDIAKAVSEDEKLLKSLKEEGRAYEKNSAEAKQNAEEQKRITDEIVSGKKRLREMGESYDELKGKIKKTAKEAEKIPTQGSGVKGKVSELSKSFSGGFSLSKLGSLAFSGVGASVAAVGIAAAGAVKGVKWLTEQAQSLKEALVPLKSYLDEGVLEDLRQQLVQLEYDNVHSAEEMAAAGTKIAKYYEGLRTNADAMRDMIANSNDFATVIGSTSEKASEYILKIAGAYKQSAFEAKGNGTIIINAAKQSTVKTEEMAQAIASSANRAAMLGISVKELAAATAKGTTSFGNASSAASTYIMMMDRLSHQSKNEFNPTVVGATKALDNLGKQKNINAILTSLLGKRQATLARVFVENATEINNATDALSNHEAAEKALAAAEGKAENMSKKLENSKKALAHEINANLTPAYAAFLDYVTWGLKGFGEAVKVWKDWLSPLVKWFSDLDKKFANSAIWQALKKYGSAFIRGSAEASFTGGAFAIPRVVKKYAKIIEKEEHQENIKKTFESNIEKYGSSPGKALIATQNAFRSTTGAVSKEDVAYMVRLYRQVLAEKRAKPNGKPTKTGADNAITDKNAEKEAKKREKAQKELNEKLKALEQKNTDESISLMKDGTEKKLKEIENDYNKRKAEIDKQEKEFKKKNKEAGKKEDLTKEQSDALAEARKLAEKEYNQKKAELYSGETNYLQESLKEYGTFQEKKLAIAMEYAQKIKDVENSGASQSDKYWQIAGLRKEQEKEEKSADASAILEKIDFYQVFGNIGDMMKGTLSQILSDLQTFVGTDKFKSMDVDQQKQIIDAIGNLREKVGTSEVGWKDMATDLQEWKNAILEAKTASEEYSKILYEYEPKINEAQKKLSNAKANGDQQGVNDAQKELDNYTSILTSSGAKVKSANDKVITSSKQLAQTTKDVTQPVDEIYQFLSASGLTTLQDVWGSILRIKGGIDGLKALKEAADGATKVGEATTEMAEDLSDAGEEAADALSEGLSKAGFIGQIIAAVLKILDVLKDGIGTVVAGLVQSVLGAIDGILKNILSGQFVEQIVGSIVQGIGNILDTVLGAIGSVISGGALSSGGPSEWFKNGNAEETEKRRQELTDAAEKLTKSIDGLKSELQKQSGIKAISTAKELYETQKQQIENARQQLENENNYHNDHHSNTYYWNTGSFEKDDGGSWDTITQLLKDYKKKNPNATTKIDSAYSYQDLLQLTPEQLDYIRTHDMQQWNAIISVGKYDASKEKWEALADLAGSLEETLNTLNESLTQISFDSLKDEFISTLMDMDSSAEDFADKFSEYLMKAVLNAQISNMMEDELNKFYKEWAKRAEANDGTLTNDDIDYLKDWWDRLVQQGLDIRDQVGAITGYTESQSRQNATSSAIEAITADQASSLIGIGYAMQIALEQGNDVRSAMSIDVASTRAAIETMGFNISEMRDMQFEGLANLQLIVKNTSPITEMNETMSQIYKLMKERY